MGTLADLRVDKEAAGMLKNTQHNMAGIKPGAA